MFIIRREGAEASNRDERRAAQEFRQRRHISQDDSMEHAAMAEQVLADLNITGGADAQVRKPFIMCMVQVLSHIGFNCLIVLV